MALNWHTIDTEFLFLTMKNPLLYIQCQKFAALKFCLRLVSPFVDDDDDVIVLLNH